MQIEFSRDVADQLFELARTKKHGSAYAIVKKAVAEFLKNVEANPIEGIEDDRSNRSK
ncbi:Uncharacterised protein [Enterobacter hormaechei]|uniref:hypothetical protein n=1 Tax=Enterobacter hormaechei TaxID=158836 RepID=UPI00125B6739|nr:hypothetical protein [Enterobacter hormaechei]VAF02835.1 Uncharacterised protein [Enterobacter hormaechei]